MLADNDGVTVAHVLADICELEVQDKEILKLANKDGVTVAHALAFKCNWSTDDDEILNLQDVNGVSVKDIIQSRRNRKRARIEDYLL